MEELKACPFCGEEAEIATESDEDGDTFWIVECTFCGAEAGGTAAKPEAVAMWNRRAAPENKPLTCEGCEAEGALQGIRCATCLRLKSEYRNDNYSTEPTS